MKFPMRRTKSKCHFYDACAFVRCNTLYYPQFFFSLLLYLRLNLCARIGCWFLALVLRNEKKKRLLSSRYSELTGKNLTSFDRQFTFMCWVWLVLHGSSCCKYMYVCEWSLGPNQNSLCKHAHTFTQANYNLFKDKHIHMYTRSNLNTVRNCVNIWLYWKFEGMLMVSWYCVL